MTPTDEHRGSPWPIKACLFDMDGLLIDSEDKYTICINRVLAEYSRPPLPWSIKAQLQGRPGPVASKIMHDWAQLPIPRDEYNSKVRAHQKDVFPDCKPLPGVPELLHTLQRSPVEIALATSSHSEQFQLKTRHQQDLFEVFAHEQRVLGDDVRIKPGRGKPAPDIWHVALGTINDKRRREGKAAIKPEECLVFEDSVAGVESGRRAGCQVVWCPHPGLLEEYKDRQEEVLAGRTGQYAEEHPGPSSQPGEIGDGWSRFMNTLEGFPYADYDIPVLS